MQNYYYKAQFDSYECSYNDGLGKNCSSWQEEGVVKVEDIKDLIKEVIEKKFYYSYNKDIINIENNTAEASWLVDDENSELSAKELVEFKNGKNQYITYLLLKIYNLQEVDLK